MGEQLEQNQASRTASRRDVRAALDQTRSSLDRTRSNDPSPPSMSSGRLGGGMRAFSIAYWGFIILCCIPFFAIALVIFTVTLPFDRRRVVLHLFSCFWGAFYIYANPIWHLRVVGREKLPWRGPAVLVANHASLIDVLVLFSLYRPFKWVSKAGNFKIPFIGWNMSLNGYVPLERGNQPSITRAVKECRK